MLLPLLLLLCASAADPPAPLAGGGDAAPVGSDAEPAAGEAAEPAAGEADEPGPSLLDREREAALRDAYRRIDGLEGVQVEVVAGVARLRGEVADPDALRAARAIAGRLDGLLWVDDRLQGVDPPVADADAALAARLREIYAAVPAMQGLEVDAQSGVVRVRGEVASLDTQRAALALAGELPGAVHVDDQTSVAHAVDKRLAPALTSLRDRALDLWSRLPLFAIGLLLLVVFWFASRWLTRLVFAERFMRGRPLLLGIAQQTARVAVFLLGVVLVLDLLDLTTIVGAMLGTAGILGVAIGFAFRDIVENYLASLILSFRQPFAKGDLIEVAGNTGWVVRLTMRETVLATFDGNHLRVPNAIVFKSVLQNFTTSPLRRFSFSVSVANDQDLDATLAICRRALAATPGVVADPGPTAFLEAFGDSALILSVAAWINQPDTDFLAARSLAMKNVKAALDAAGIDQPEPILRVFTGELRDGAPPARAKPERSPIEPVAEPSSTKALPDREAAVEVDLLR